MKHDQQLILAKQIINLIEEYGHKAYIVGGYVRDRLFNKSSHDIDLATSAAPDVVTALFAHVIPTGLQHGTVTVMIDGYGFEVTTFRTESTYEQHRRPTQVSFVNDLNADLLRRDFTINAMAMDKYETIIDPYNGQADMAQGVLKCVGEASRRFDEDALRMLRCIRFAAEYELSIEQNTWIALLEQRDKMIHIAVERIHSEMDKIILGKQPAVGLQLLASCDLLSYVNEHARLRVDHCSAAVAQSLALFASSDIRWALALIGAGCSAEEAYPALQKAAFPGKRAKYIRSVIAVQDHFTVRQPVEAHDLQQSWQLASLTFGRLAMSDWLQLQQQLELLYGAVLPMQQSERYDRQQWQQLLQYGSDWLAQIPAENLSQLAASGSDLIQAGLTAGPSLGRILNQLLQAVVIGELPNDRSAILAAAIRINDNEGTTQ